MALVSQWRLRRKGNEYTAIKAPSGQGPLDWERPISAGGKGYAMLEQKEKTMGKVTDGEVILVTEVVAANEGFYGIVKCGPFDSFEQADLWSSAAIEPVNEAMKVKTIATRNWGMGLDS